MKVPAMWRDLAFRVEAEFEVEVNFNDQGIAVCPQEVKIQTKLRLEKFENGKAHYVKAVEVKSNA